MRHCRTAQALAHLSSLRQSHCKCFREVTMFPQQPSGKVSKVQAMFDVAEEETERVPTRHRPGYVPSWVPPERPQGAAVDASRPLTLEEMGVDLSGTAMAGMLGGGDGGGGGGGEDGEEDDPFEAFLNAEVMPEVSDE